MALTYGQSEMLRLVKRSLDKADGEWADVSDQLWPFAQEIKRHLPELVELHPDKQAIRLTHEGVTVLKYI